LVPCQLLFCMLLLCMLFSYFFLDNRRKRKEERLNINLFSWFFFLGSF
jgi:hypothetical protein